LPEALASNNPEKARAQGSDRSVRPTLHYLTHMGSPFDILGHRADDLVVPDPGPEYRSCGSGRIGGLPSSAQPYEGIVLQRNPRQRVNPISSLPILTRRNVQHGEAR